jgi:hypothetical protein
LLVLGAGYAVVLTTASSCTVSDKLVNSCRPWLGAAANKYPGVTLGDYKAQILAHEKAIGRQVDVAHTYHPIGSDELSANDKYFISRPGTYLFTNWKPVSKWVSAAGGDATVNASIDKMAASIKSVSPNKIFLTINHEPENDVSGGGQGCTITYKGSAGTPADYRAMWSNIRKRFDAAGAKNVVWVMDYMNYPPWDCLVDDLYPGNHLVDWVMFNAYGSGTGADATKNVQHFVDVLKRYQDSTHDFNAKPWGIIEWNVHDTTAETAYKYYDDMKAIANNNTFPKIKAYMVFDSIGPEGNDNRIAYRNGTYDAERLEHYKQFAHSSIFARTTPAPSDTERPSTPGNLTATVAGQQVNLAWTASTDNIAVKDYEIRRNTTTIGTTTATSFSDTTVELGKTYSYTVIARDAAGNTSSTSSPAEVVMPQPVSSSDQPGLAATYFANKDLRGLGTIRTDATVNFSWGTGAPLAGIPNDTFSARWTGRVTAPETTTYTFYTQADDGVRLWVNDTLLIDDWVNHGVTERSGTIALTKGQRYNVRLEYYEASGGASVKLLWKGGQTSKQVIPSTHLVTSSYGLSGSYFSDQQLTTVATRRLDPQVAFTWAGAPLSALPADHFSVRWTGQVVASASGSHTFYTQTNDGVRLWVGGKLLVDDWTNHGTLERSGATNLTAGIKYPIVMEYYDNTGSGVAQLHWSGPAHTKQLVPARSLLDR